MTHADVVQIAVEWLRSSSCPHGKHTVVFAELSTIATPERPDVIGWDPSGISTVIECKVSRSDFLKDRAKRRVLGRRRYYMAPAGVIRLSDVQGGDWGLVETHRNGLILKAKTVLLTDKAYSAEVGYLAAVVRRHERGVPWDAKTSRFEAYGKGRRKT